MNKDKPLVSYVLTAYNIENFIEESVKSAFAQTYEPLEIILSDDCSTDHTFEIMKKMASEYAGPHKIVLNRNDQNLGITRHMNKTYLELAQGEIIIAAHGDDISAPERAQVLTDFLIRNANCMQVANSAVVCDSNMVPLSDYLQRNFQVSNERKYALGSGAHVSVGFSAFRRTVMSFFGPLSDKCPTEDDPIGFRAILLGEIALLPDILTHYRKHDGSNSNPENFERFPLDEIYNQNLVDMSVCVAVGKITADTFEKEKKQLYESKEYRKVYRQYFAKRTFGSFIKVLAYPKLKIRGRLSLIKGYVLYLSGIRE